MTGVSPDRVIGKTREEFGRPDPDDPSWICLLEDLRVRIPFRDFRYSVKRSDGSDVHFSASGVPVFDIDGTFKGYRGTGANISARVEAESEAMRARALLENGIEAINDGFAVYDGNDRLVLCNEQYRAMHSEVADIIAPGVTFKEIARATVCSGQYPDAEGREEQWIRDRIQVHQNCSGATIWPMSNGRWYLVSDTRTPDGHRVSLSTDITEIKQREQALRESEEQLHLILDSTSEGVYGIDLDGNCTFCNSACLRILGYGGEGDLLGKNMHNLIHHTRIDGTPYPIQECESTQACRKGERSHIEDETFWRKDGARIPVEYRASPIYQEGTFIGAVVTFSDISQRKASEARLQNAQKMEAVGQLTGGIAHDFNNLLTIILGNLRLLSEILPISDDDTLEILNDTISAADDGAQLTRSLLAFSHTRSQKPQWTDVNELLDDFLRLLHHTFQEDIDIRVRKNRDITPVFVDRTQLESALLNLAINARDAMLGGGRITIETSTINNRTNGSSENPDLEPGKYIGITVSDTGTGIQAQHMDHVLEPFFTTKETGQGSGLGLSMVYGFAKQSGGGLKIVSEPDSGTQITILLPETTSVRVLDHAVGAVAGEKRPAVLGEGETILIVEDEKRLLLYATRALRSIGYRVLTADNAVAAVSLLEKDPTIDLVFSDIVMPGGMTGRDLAGWVAENRPKVKVLLTSGFSKRAGVLFPEYTKDFPMLKKPYTKEQVADRIYAALHAEHA